MSWKNLVEALKLEPYELAYYLVKEYEETSLAEKPAVMGQCDNLGADTDGAALMVMLPVPLRPSTSWSTSSVTQITVFFH
jgi:hypothetical protein